MENDIKCSHQIRKSDRVSNITFVCTLLVVILHLRVSSDDVIVTFRYYPYINTFIGALTDAAVPTFFALSTSLFFRNYTHGSYPQKLRRRFHSLLIPYFCFSLLSLLLFHVSKYLLKGYDEVTPLQIIKDFLLATNDPPIWFIRPLFLFAVISPILFEIIKRIPLSLSLVIAASWTFFNIFYPQSYSSLQFWMPIVYCFSALSIKSEWFVTTLLGGGKFSNRAIFFSSIAFFFIILIYVADAPKKSNEYYLYRMMAPFFVFMLSDIFVWKPMKIQRFSFFIFMFHFFPRLITLHMNAYPIYSLLRIVFALLLCVAIGTLVERNMPKVWSFLNGGRI